jgi:hypothetical protein
MRTPVGELAAPLASVVRLDRSADDPPWRAVSNQFNEARSPAQLTAKAAGANGSSAAWE